MARNRRVVSGKQNKQLIKLGPFSGGLNEVADPSLIADTELSVCQNYIPKTDGTLVPRFGAKRDPWATNFNRDLATWPNQAMNNYVGEIEGPGDRMGKTPIVFRRNYAAGSYTGTFSYWDGGKWEDIYNAAYAAYEPPFALASGTSPVFTCCAYYDDYVYFFSRQVNLARRSAANPSGLIGPSALVGTVPAAEKALVFKDRIFLFKDNTVYYSKATDPTVWSAPDGGFFDISSGDSQIIQAVLIKDDQILIFRDSSIYSFSFVSDPTVDGYLQVLTTDIGALSAALYNNEVFIVNRLGVFKMYGRQFVNISSNLNLRTSLGTGISVFSLYNTTTLTVADDPINPLLILNYYSYRDDGFTYVMNLKTNAWSRWDFSGSPYTVLGGNAIGSANVPQYFMFHKPEQGFSAHITFSGYGAYDFRNRIFYFTSGGVAKSINMNALAGEVTTFRYTDEDIYDHLFSERMMYVEHKIRTKRFDFGSPAKWKRLFHWFFSSPEATTHKQFKDLSLYVNSRGVSASSSQTVDFQENRINTKSARFQYLSFGLESNLGDYTARTGQPLYSPEIPPTIEAIFVKVEAGATVSD